MDVDLASIIDALAALVDGGDQRRAANDARAAGVDRSRLRLASEPAKRRGCPTRAAIGCDSSRR